jgi:lysozyme
MTILGFNAIIDLFHSDNVTSWELVRQNGVHAVIHKATQGIGMQDPAYHARRLAAKAAGFLFGSYHYSSGDDVAKQVQNYLSWAQPQHDELMALDVEPSSSGPDMTHDQMIELISLVQAQTGRLPVIYGGASLLKPITTGKKNSPAGKCSLWYARYPKPNVTQPGALPDPWSDWTIWQYTDGHSGPDPKSVPGAACDRDTYNGTGSELHQKWPLL